MQARQSVRGSARSGATSSWGSSATVAERALGEGGVLAQGASEMHNGRIFLIVLAIGAIAALITTKQWLWLAIVVGVSIVVLIVRNR